VKRATLATLIVLGILFIDQAVKIYIKTQFYYGESVFIFGQEWAQIKFIENPGMAFGWEFGGVTGKYILSIFRILMSVFLIYFIRELIKAKESKGFIAAFALIIAGAIGNILDSLYFGLIFSSSSHGKVATMFPDGGGYAPFLQGKVVDMFYFPMFKGHLPEWLPIKGGDYFEFFRPIFNVADASISIGVFLIILFFRKYFMKRPMEEKNLAKDANPAVMDPS
jgi:signal peptidase II